MKFRKNLSQVVAVCDPSWAPYWMNYKFLKKIVSKIIHEERHECRRKLSSSCTNRCITDIVKSSHEVEFFRELQRELKKTDDFFKSEEEVCKIRKGLIEGGFHLLKDSRMHLSDEHTINMVLQACLQFFKDILFLENFAIMNYCAFSKILKKHDKHTG